MPKTSPDQKRPGETTMAMSAEELHQLIASVREQRKKLDFRTTWEELKKARDEGRRY